MPALLLIRELPRQQRDRPELAFHGPCCTVQPLALGVNAADPGGKASLLKRGAHAGLGRICLVICKVVGSL